ncbi:transcriptional regulator ATRX-like protein, partial [Trifolium medium]|nr:transcriptional regulator ATRX-like protein [Trifolium medium]
MPGTIMVSVLEFMDLPFSSSTSIRASLGKIEYQISDKGNFS